MTDVTKTLAGNKESHTDKIWDFFCSLKLTIITLLLLAVVSIIGTVIQQNAQPAEYIREYGKGTYNLFRNLQFVDMYHSWWFVGLLALFSINLICCSIKHFPRAWKFVRDPALIPSAGMLKGAANRLDATTKETPQQMAERLTTLLKKEFASPKLTEADGKLYLFAQKGIYSRFGAYMTHLSILIVMTGAIIGNIWGFKAFVNITEGTSVSQVWPRFGGNQPIKLGFSVRCDDFNVSYYPGTMRPKDYNSDLVVLEHGKEVLKKKIEVNDPLTYKGLTFYQSSYGLAGNANFKLKVTDNATGKVMNYSASQGEQIGLPGGYSFTVSEFTESDRQFGPAIQLHVNSPDGKFGRPFVVWQNYPQFDVKRGGKFSFALLSFDQLQFTGLQVAKDPGVDIVWFGCFLMVFGSLTAFFVSHKRIWVCLEESGGKTNITVAANAHRNQPGFSLAFDELKQKLEDTIENKSQVKEG